MARKHAKKSSAKRSSKRCPPKHCPPCTAAAMARNEFSVAKRAGSCSGQERALTKLKSEIAKNVDGMSAGARRLAFTELLRKEQAVQACERSESNRFNGLFGLGLGIL